MLHERASAADRLTKPQVAQRQTGNLKIQAEFRRASRCGRTTPRKAQLQGQALGRWTGIVEQSRAVRAKEPDAIEVNEVSWCFGHPHLRFPSDIAEITRHNCSGRESGYIHKPRA